VRSFGDEVPTPLISLCLVVVIERRDPICVKTGKVRRWYNKDISGRGFSRWRINMNCKWAAAMLTMALPLMWNTIRKGNIFYDRRLRTVSFRFRIWCGAVLQFYVWSDVFEENAEWMPKLGDEGSRKTKSIITSALIIFTVIIKTHLLKKS
jgi:hypothetical protein